jgi:hypothetical protein
VGRVTVNTHIFFFGLIAFFFGNNVIFSPVFVNDINISPVFGNAFIISPVFENTIIIISPVFVNDINISPVTGSDIISFVFGNAKTLLLVKQQKWLSEFCVKMHRVASKN